MAQYVRGNAARQLNNAPAYERRRVHVHDPLHQHRRRHHMSLGYLLFLSLAMVLMVGTLAWYISLQSQITNSVKNIATLESQLNNLKQDNDEAYNRANGNVDLEEVKRIAIQEYGMTYATDGQIVTYSDGGGNDYVRQIAPIPQTESK
ncbi:cell division protein FtsL [Butyrivibrio sp. X503]|uniref:cell division protein FtsL n=1 Tax=Butyrivibrio sp. X503 TaxID=2364878 RepID=UPI000EAA0A8D|nr:cell division protein FtsL [Butyrivibrio sp. X503]RKM55676.1 cell division protein FtsL [Butyrivibrio sp. X503]